MTHAPSRNRPRGIVVDTHGVACFFRPDALPVPITPTTRLVCSCGQPLPSLDLVEAVALDHSHSHVCECTGIWNFYLTRDILPAPVSKPRTTVIKWQGPFKSFRDSDDCLAYGWHALTHDEWHQYVASLTAVPEDR